MPILDENDRSEILRYSGWRGGEITPETEKRIEESIKAANKAALIKSTYRFIDIKETDAGVLIAGTGVCLEGSSIKRHLNGVNRAVLLGATLGNSFDVEINRLMIKDAALAVLVNSAGVALVEKALDELQKEIDAKLEDGFHTGMRFSPGYGDLPLETGKDIIRLLNAEKLLGIRMNSSYLMNPGKSVTAIAGIVE